MNKVIYDQMRLIVFFDMPVDTKKHQKAYIEFRKFLLDDGFIMLQYSVYSRFCHNLADCEKHINRIKKNSPKLGNIRLLKITEKQYQNMIMIYGEESENELINDSEYLVSIE